MGASNILITGASSGLGKAMAQKLEDDGHFVIKFDLKDEHDVRDANSITRFRDKISGIGGVDIDVLINNAGVNIIDWLENFDEEQWDEVMNVNAKGIYLMSREFLPSLMRTKGTILNIVSNAAHMPMTCSLAYNASKGAAHIMTLQMARELTKNYGITVFGIAPNKLSGTGMSNSIDQQVVKTRGWTEEYAKEYQLNGLLTGEETPPELLAEFIAYLLKTKQNHKYLSGCILPYGA